MKMDDRHQVKSSPEVIGVKEQSMTTPNLEGQAGPQDSYRQIVKSSAIIGSSSAINMLFGVLRTKCIAILLGPSGVASWVCTSLSPR